MGKADAAVTKDEIVYALIREALFDEKTKEYPRDAALWYKVFTEMRQQTVCALPSCVVAGRGEIPVALHSRWEKVKNDSVQKYVQRLSVQSLALEMLNDADVTAAVIKGTAAACYYPYPEFRAMGDIDLLVWPKEYRKAVEVLKVGGFRVIGRECDRYHTALQRYDVVVEVHRSPADVLKDSCGKTIHRYILSGLHSVEMNTLGPDTFPILPWKQNGMELLWHIKQHLYNGLGLRQLIDWMMFADHYLDDERYNEYAEDMRKCGLLRLAIHVTRLCQLHLGLREEGISWCRMADEALCEDLLAFVIEQGNFGIKRGNKDKVSKVFSKYTDPVLFISQLQEVGAREWKSLKKFPQLKPMAWMYAGVWELRNVTAERGSLFRFIKEIRNGKRRARILKKLYG